MDFHTDPAALAAMFAAGWLPVFLVAAIAHWFLLAGRRWRSTVVAAALVLEIGLALAILFAPVLDPSLRLRMMLGFNAIGGLPAVAALSALVVTVALVLFLRLGQRFDNSSGSKPLGGLA